MIDDVPVAAVAVVAAAAASAIPCLMIIRRVASLSAASDLMHALQGQSVGRSVGRRVW